MPPEMVGNFDTPDIEGLFDYTTEGTLGGPSVTRGVTLRELQEGTIIETDNDSPKEDEDRWWSREELLQHIDNPFGLEDVEELGKSFDEKIAEMEVIVPDRVWKRTIRPGTGPPITEKNAVSFHYYALLEHADEPFDSSLLRGRPHINRLDQGDILPGLFHGILGMKLNEKAEILFHHEYGFGKYGCPPRIPPESMVLYVVEIMRIYAEGNLEDMEIMTPEELASQPFEKIYSCCNSMRTSGNSYFAAEGFKEAAIRYRKAINILEKYMFRNKEEEEKGHELLSKLYPNIACAYVHLKKVQPAMANCKKALRINENNVRALYNYGRAKFQNGDFREAEEYFERALALKPGDKSMIQYLEKIENCIEEEKRQTKELYQDMASKFFKFDK